MDEPVDDGGHAGETVVQKQRRLFASGRDTGRIEYFTDAVIAIALTLLVLDLRLPQVPKDADLWHAIASLWQQYLGYALSFAVIGLSWVFHHRRFRVIVRYDTTLMWLNLAFLFFIAVVPFPTSILAEYSPAAPAVILYAAIVAVITALGAVNWAYAYRAGLMSASIDPATYRYILGANLVAPIVFGLSIPFALVLEAVHVDTTWAMWFWVLNWLASSLYARIGGRRVAVRATAG